MRIRPALVVLCLALGAGVARADEIVLPSLDGNTGSCWPFGCGTRIQTVFDASLFRSAMQIDQLELFNTTRQSAEGSAEPATYRFFLSTTPKSSATIGRDLNANVGPDVRQVAQWTVPSWTVFFTTLTLPLDNPFVYSPFTGNLLLDIQKDRTVNAGDGPIYANVNTNAPGTATVIDSFGGNARGGLLARNEAINVGFGGHPFGPAFTDPAAMSPTPEPASLLLMTAGFGWVAVRRRARRSKYTAGRCRSTSQPT